MILSIPLVRTHACYPGTWVRSNNQKVDLFAENLANIFQPNQIQSENNLEITDNNNSKEISLVTPQKSRRWDKKQFKSKKSLVLI